MTAGQMIKALQLGIKNGHYAKDDMLTVATSKNGISYDGQIEVESVSMEIFCGKAGITLKGPVLEVKGSKMRYYKFDCGCVESVSVVKKGKLYRWKYIARCNRHWKGNSEEENEHGPKFYETFNYNGYKIIRINKRDAAIYKLAGGEK